MTEQPEHLVQAFLEKSCKKIWSRKTRRVVQLELLDHINTAREHHEQTGLAPYEATKIAIADLGDPQALSSLLSRAHNPWHDIATMLMPALGCIFLYFFGALIYGYDLNFALPWTLAALGSLVCAAILYFVGFPKNRPIVAPLLLAAVVILFAAARIGTTSGVPPRLDLGYTQMFDQLTVNVFEIGFCILLVVMADLMSKASWHLTLQRWVIWGTFVGASVYYLLNYSLPYFLVFSLAFIRMLMVSKAPREFVNKAMVTIASVLIIFGVTLWALKDSKLTMVLAHLYAIDPPKYELYRSSFTSLFKTHTATTILGCLLSAFMLRRYFEVMQTIKSQFGKILAHGLWIKYTVSFGWFLLGPLGLIPTPREPIHLPFVHSPSVQFFFCYVLLGVLLNICREERRPRIA